MLTTSEFLTIFTTILLITKAALIFLLPLLEENEEMHEFIQEKEKK